MSAVDVLAVLDAVPDWLILATVNPANENLRGSALKVREARAAVAELIEAAEGVWNTPRPAGSDPNGRYSKAEKRLAAALANIGAAP